MVFRFVVGRCRCMIGRCRFMICRCRFIGRCRCGISGGGISRGSIIR